jgi:hypothetical protein
VRIATVLGGKSAHPQRQLAVWRSLEAYSSQVFRCFDSPAFVVEALNMIGAPKTADICQHAIAAAFSTGLPESVEAIRLAAADFSDEVLEKLESFDQEFFSYPHNLTELLFAYVSQHPQEFGDLPRPDDA